MYTATPHGQKQPCDDSTGPILRKKKLLSESQIQKIFDAAKLTMLDKSIYPNPKK